MQSICFLQEPVSPQSTVARKEVELVNLQKALVNHYKGDEPEFFEVAVGDVVPKFLWLESVPPFLVDVLY